MSNLDVEMIRSSFEIVKPIALNAANKFYEFLFTDFPASRSLFKHVDLDKQQKALIDSLTFVVNNLENQDKLSKYLNDLGHRHVSYGTKEAHFDWVGSSLIKTFSFFFADKWTPQLEQEWTKAYSIIAQYMQEGMAREQQDVGTSKPSPKIENKPEQVASNSKEESSNIIKISESKNIEISDDLKNKIKMVVQRSVKDYVEQEIKKALNEEINKITDEEIVVQLNKIVNF